MRFQPFSRIDGRFLARIGLMLATAAGSLAIGISALAQDHSTLTPDNLIAFAAGDNDSALDIYVIKADGTGLVRLTGNNGKDPAWSPDGKHIAFMSTRDGNKEIYVMDADGRNVRRLTYNQVDDGYPAWSPDGTHIAFMSGRPEGDPFMPEQDNDYDIYVMNADGSDVTVLTHDGLDNGYPAWSPDGGSISFSTMQNDQWDLYKMNADGSDVTQLTFDAYDDADSAWSPDGQRILFTIKMDGPTWYLYTMNTDGSSITRIENGATESVLGAWSQDGQLIAFAEYKNGGSDLTLMRADGTDKHHLTFRPGVNAFPAWQPLP